MMTLALNNQESLIRHKTNKPKYSQNIQRGGVHPTKESVN